MNKNDNKLISYKVLQIFNEMAAIDSKTRKYGTDVLLYDAEMHIIKVIKENEGIHVTALAEMLQVTKGAVSQNLKRLQKKDMVIKQPDRANKSRLLLYLTEKGEIAYRNHEILHADFDEIFEKILKEEPEEYRKFLYDFLSKLDTSLKKFEVK